MGFSTAEWRDEAKHAWTQVDELRKENATLRTQLANLREEELRMREKDAEIERLREQRNKLAEYARRLWAASCYEWGDEFQGIGEELGVCELRPVVPGSDDAEEWGEDAELYYLAPWVIGGEDE